MPDEDGEIDSSDFKDLSFDDLSVEELRELAKERKIKGVSKMEKQEIIDLLKSKDA